MSFIPHTPEDIEKMLKVIGIKKLSEVFDEIPKNLPRPALSSLPGHQNEMQMLAHGQHLSQQVPLMRCFLGAGCYDHHIPAVVWDVATRGEFLTSYTPYQAEVSQGTLQVLYEFQSMIAELFALDVANASLYDGATALAEAILMAKRIQRQNNSQKVLIPQGLHPHYQEVLNTILKQQQIEMEILPLDSHLGVTDINTLQAVHPNHYFAVVILQTNYFGQIEPFDEISNWAEKNQVLRIACVNPLLQSVLKPPGEWAETGVDIACGEGQPLGIPMGSGGPLLGLLACKKEHVRQIPGRLAGQTLDSQQRIGYTLTLQAREQHIRRGKATSNICTNVGLNATAATIFMSIMGPQGLKRMAEQSFHQCHELVERLCQIPGVQKAFASPYFHETVVSFPVSVSKILQHLEKENILGGLPLESTHPEFKNLLLICATEKRSAQDIDDFVLAVREATKTNHCTVGA